MGERNTLKRGRVRFIIFREEDVWYGVALEFGIVITEKSAEAVFLSLNQAARGYLHSLIKAKLRPIKANPLINKPATPEYEELWDRIQQKKAIPSPIRVEASGTLTV